MNADDFGLSEGINRGIESAFREGILRSTSLMPNGAAFKDAVRVAKANPGLGVGIHISLVDERALAVDQRLKGLISPDGSLPKSHTHFLRKLLLCRFGSTEVRYEVEAQVKRVLDAGITPTHIDSHQHLHMLPGVFGAVLDAAQDAGIKVMRLPMGLCPAIPTSLRSVQHRALWNLCVCHIADLRRAGIRCADHFHGFIESGHMNEKSLSHILGRLGPGVNEVMMHPGCSDAATSARYRWGYHWDDEHTALTSPRIRQEIEERGIRLASFADAWEEQ